MKSLRKHAVKKTKLILCKPLFIVYVTVLKSYTVVQNETPLLKKWAWHMYTKLL